MLIVIIISGFGIYGAAVVPDSGVGNTSHSFSMNSCLLLLLVCVSFTIIGQP